jgi:hypothetical protein
MSERSERTISTGPSEALCAETLSPSKQKGHH